MMSILAAQALAKSPSDQIASKVLAIPTGAMVKVRLTSGETLRGRLGEASERQFVLRIAKNNRIESRNIAFDDVRSIGRLYPQRRTRLSDWLIGAGVVGAITVIALVVVHAMHG
jgi:hypothetical protein